MRAIKHPVFVAMSPILVFTMMLFVGCTDMPILDQILGTDDKGGGDPAGLATVEEIQIAVLESFPLQVHVIAKGYLRDGCTQISDISQRLRGNQFNVRIETERDPDLICTQQLVPFEEVIPLEVYGLKAGEYTVDVNGVRDSFVFTMDNVLPGERPEETLPETQVQAAVGETFEVRLDANPTTGYQWQLASALDPEVVELVGSEYRSDAPDHIVGAGGVEIWTFRAVGQGNATITLDYVRPWESHVSLADQHRIKVVVQ